MSRNLSLRLMVALLFMAVLHLAALPTLSAPASLKNKPAEVGARSHIVALCLMPLSPVIADTKPQDSSSALQKFSDPLGGLASDLEMSRTAGQHLGSGSLRSTVHIQGIPYWLLYRSLLI
jgi:hypothetical protein